MVISKTAVSAMVAAALFSSAFAHGQASSAAGTRVSVPLMHEDFPAVPSRVVLPVDDTKLVRLSGNTHPLAQPEFDQGAIEPQTLLERIQLVLQRSPEQESALAKFMEDQQTQSSPDFHHWLTPEAFGKLYGPSDADIAQVTSWLQNHGFQIYLVSQGRVTIEFTGTAAQVSAAFHTEIHKFDVNGEEHIANTSDPQIPEALAPVINGIASLHNFFPRHQSVTGRRIKMDLATHKFSLADDEPKSETPHTLTAAGPSPDFEYYAGGTFEEITPYDFATIYNVLPLWNAGINGTGVDVAISAASDINVNDVNTFRKDFGLPATKLSVVHNGTDPGYVNGAQGENTLDVEMSGGVAKDSTIVLVVSKSTSTTFGGQLSDSYIVDHGTAPIMSASYGSCELALGTAGNAAMNKIWQQGAAEGISEFESSGDQGSAGCTSQDTPAPNPTGYGLNVNGDASSPYVTAVGGTDFSWQIYPLSTYWNSSNASNGATAKGYIPEIPWNATCASTMLLQHFFEPKYGLTTTEEVCNATLNNSEYGNLVKITGGSGGESLCTTNNGSTFASCSGGYAKPSWQSGVAGIPNDGHRDLPDVSLFAAGGYPAGIIGSAWLFCQSSSGTNGCDYSNPNYVIYQEVGGTSASSPAMAGVMALILQKNGYLQGLANPEFYKLASKETLSSCNSSTVKNGNKCVFYDTTYSNNSQPCIKGTRNCTVNNSSDKLGVVSGYTTNTGYDRATGLGSINVTNMANAWTATDVTTSTLTPSSESFPTTKKGSTSKAIVATLKNTGTIGLQVKGLSFVGTDASSFIGTTTCHYFQVSESSCTISISFKPAATGSLTATLEITDNTSSSPQKITLKGTGN